MPDQSFHPLLTLKPDTPHLAVVTGRSKTTPPASHDLIESCSRRSVVASPPGLAPHPGAGTGSRKWGQWNDFGIAKFSLSDPRLINQINKGTRKQERRDPHSASTPRAIYWHRWAGSGGCAGLAPILLGRAGCKMERGGTLFLASRSARTLNSARNCAL